MKNEFTYETKATVDTVSKWIQEAREIAREKGIENYPYYYGNGTIGQWIDYIERKNKPRVDKPKRMIINLTYTLNHADSFRESAKRKALLRELTK